MIYRLLCISLLVVSCVFPCTLALSQSVVRSKSLLQILPTQLPLEMIYQEPLHLEPLQITFHVVASTILNGLPWLKLHHIVLLTAKDPQGGALTCAIDFSPVNQTQTSTLLHLLRGDSVPGEVRMKFISGMYMTLLIIG